MAAFLALLFFPVVLALIVGTIWFTDRKQRWIAITLTVLASSCEALLCVGTYRQSHYWDGVDLNPVVTSEEMAGTWRYENEWIKLSPDGAFETNDSLRGTWMIQGRGFESQSSQSNESGRPIVAIRDNGRLLLLKPYDADPDSWIREYAFVRESR